MKRFHIDTTDSGIISGRPGVLQPTRRGNETLVLELGTRADWKMVQENDCGPDFAQRQIANRVAR